PRSGEIGRLGALEDLVDKDGAVPKQRDEVCTVRHQQASLGPSPVRAGRESVGNRELSDSIALNPECRGSFERPWSRRSSAAARNTGSLDGSTAAHVAAGPAGSGNVALEHVVHDHPVCAEAPAEGPDG